MNAAFHRFLNTGAYLWETHLHTSETSICGQATAAEMVRAYRKAGYYGIIVTDHFLNGNSHARRSGAWTKRIDIFFRGYRAAKEAGRAQGLRVLAGCEFSFRGADFLTYGVPETFYYDQPDLADLDADEFVGRVRLAGGFVSQAHPFRREWYMPPDVAKRWDIVDGMEVINGSHRPEHRQWDDDALKMARGHNLVQTAGSDAHAVRDAATAALAFDEAFDTDRMLIGAMRAGLGTPVRLRDL